VTTTPSLPMLYFLVEESARELDSRILLGTVAAEQGMSSCIVPQWLIWKKFDVLPPGILLFKGSNTVQTQHMIAARKSGHLVATLEEEALGLTQPLEIERQFDIRTPEACDLVLAQGSHLRDVIAAKFPAAVDRIVVTGNPRVDLLRPPFSHAIETEGEKIKKIHGDYVLINTNYGAINPRIEDTYAFFNMCQQVGNIDPDRPEDWDDFMGRCDWEKGNLDLLTRVIGAFLLDPEYPKLIIRPHPAENIAKWREAYRGVENVSIIREGDHGPWTLGAKLMIHTGCTTGLEAALLGTSVLCLEGGISDWHGVHTSNFVNPTAATVDDAVEMIDHALSDNSPIARESEATRQALERNTLPWPEDLAANKVISALRALAARAEFRGATAKDVLAFQTGGQKPSKNKIDPLAFTNESVSRVAAGFASDLGHTTPPSVRSNGSGMIVVSPSE
jgi:surface carbohydrate biosynthesis protein